MASRFLGGQVKANCGVDGSSCLHELTLNKVFIDTLSRESCLGT